MINKFKYQITLSIAIILGVLILQSLLNSFYNTIEINRANNLEKAHSDAVIKAKARIDTYATLISALETYVQDSKNFPSNQDIQSYMKSLTKNLEFDDLVIANYLDTTQTFNYTINIKQLNLKELKLKNTTNIKPNDSIRKLNKLLFNDDAILLGAISLKNGWAGLPINFSVRNIKNNTVG